MVDIAEPLDRDRTAVVADEGLDVVIIVIEEAAAQQHLPVGELGAAADLIGGQRLRPVGQERAIVGGDAGEEAAALPPARDARIKQAARPRLELERDPAGEVAVRDPVVAEGERDRPRHARRAEARRNAQEAEPERVEVGGAADIGALLPGEAQPADQAQLIVQLVLDIAEDRGGLGILVPACQRCRTPIPASADRPGCWSARAG